MANNLGVATGADAIIKTTDNAAVHTPHHNIEIGGVTPALDSGAAGVTVLRTVSATDSPEVTSLAIIDDWDETDRAKVNIIAGQAGVDGGAGAATAKTLRVTMDTGQLGSLGQAANAASAPVTVSSDQDASKTDDAAFTPGTSKVWVVGFEADESSTDSIDEGDAGAARITLDRKQIVTPQPHTTGGLSIFRSIDLDETEEDVKTSAGQIYGLWVTNTATSTRFVKFYNATAANVTVGTTTPVITIGIPGNSSDDVSGLFASAMGIAFDTAISAAATTGVADNDTGAPGANEVIINVFYK